MLRRGVAFRANSPRRQPTGRVPLPTKGNLHILAEMSEQRGASETSGASEWTESFYQELRAIAQRAFADERKGHTLQPTAAVHEVCLRLMSGSGLPDVPRTERVALAAPCCASS